MPIKWCMYGKNDILFFLLYKSSIKIAMERKRERKIHSHTHYTAKQREWEISLVVFCRVFLFVGLYRYIYNRRHICRTYSQTQTPLKYTYLNIAMTVSASMELCICGAIAQNVNATERERKYTHGRQWVSQEYWRSGIGFITNSEQKKKVWNEVRTSAPESYHWNDSTSKHSRFDFWLVKLN